MDSVLQKNSNPAYTCSLEKQTIFIKTKMKVSETFFPVVLYSFVWIKMKPTEQYFPLVLFIMLYKVVLAFDSVDEIVKCDH